METTRQNKISRLIQKELGELLRRQTAGLRGVIVSVTGCRISPDLSYCNVYLSFFPSERADELLKNLKENGRTLRYDLGQRLRYQLRIIPELRFFRDDTLDYLEHIDELLKH